MNLRSGHPIASKDRRGSSFQISYIQLEPSLRYHAAKGGCPVIWPCLLRHTRHHACVRAGGMLAMSATATKGMVSHRMLIFSYVTRHGRPLSSIRARSMTLKRT
nr:hypothetical protein CFP56_31828 [Quercus suber]